MQPANLPAPPSCVPYPRTHHLRTTNSDAPYPYLRAAEPDAGRETIQRYILPVLAHADGGVLNAWNLINYLLACVSRAASAEPNADVPPRPACYRKRQHIES
jgi:hypothetical protein